MEENAWKRRSSWENKSETKRARRGNGSSFFGGGEVGARGLGVVLVSLSPFQDYQYQ